MLCRLQRFLFGGGRRIVADVAGTVHGGHMNRLNVEVMRDGTANKGNRGKTGVRRP